jgi:hypothetical protein
MDVHLGYGKHVKRGVDEARSNTRKKVKGDFGKLEIETPRDRESSFEPQLVKKPDVLRGFSASPSPNAIEDAQGRTESFTYDGRTTA